MNMFEELRWNGFRLVTDTSRTDWARRRQSGDVFRVDFQVPAGFDKYCRILHRAHDDQSGYVARWSHYAQAVGVAIEQDTHWSEIVHRDPSLSGCFPEEGSLDKISRTAFLDVVNRTLAPEACLYAGYWEGIAPMHIPGISFPTAVLGLRNQVMFEVALSALTCTFNAAADAPFQFPAVLYPEDRSWYLSTDVDYNSTLVGGTEQFIDAVLEDDTIEALAISPHVDLTYRALP